MRIETDRIVIRNVERKIWKKRTPLGHKQPNVERIVIFIIENIEVRKEQ